MNIFELNEFLFDAVKRSETKEDWSKWRSYKSNKDVWIENQEKLSAEHIENCNGCAECEE